MKVSSASTMPVTSDGRFPKRQPKRGGVMTDTPQVLLAYHLKALKREYDK